VASGVRREANKRREEQRGAELLVSGVFCWIPCLLIYLSINQSVGSRSIWLAWYGWCIRVKLREATDEREREKKQTLYE